MRITGAVLERSGDAVPYASSRPLTLRELELDAPGPDELLVRIEVASVCHSDLSVVDGSRLRPLPMLLGHEAAGIVEEVGDRVDLPVGARVVMTFLPRCGSCTGCASNGRTPCVLGSAANSAGALLGGAIRLHDGDTPVRHHLGVSGFASHAVVDRRSVVRVAADVPASVAAMLGCAVLTGGGAVLNAGRPEPGQTLAVVGLGGVGMAAVLTGLALEEVRVVGIDANAEKVRLAKQLGIDDAHLVAEIPDELVADVVIEAVGSARAFESAVRLTAPGGRMVTVGLPPPDDLASISPLALVAGGRSVIGSYLGSSVPERDIPVFVDLWRRGRLPVEGLISDVIELGDVNEAMDALAAGTAMRQVISFDP